MLLAEPSTVRRLQPCLAPLHVDAVVLQGPDTTLSPELPSQMRCCCPPLQAALLW